MSEWTSDQLGKLVSFQKGKKVKTSPFQLSGFRRYLGAGSLVGKHDRYASTYLSVQATENDILMLWDGERSGLVGHKLSGVVSSTVSKLSPNEKITADYLYYYLLQNFEWIQNRRTGTGVPHVPKDLGRLLVVGYPETGLHQQKIATILQTIEKTEALIGKYQQIKAGLMHDLFTRGITTDGKLRPPREEAPELYQETAIGWIPKSWQFTSCKNVCEKIIDCKNRTPPITREAPVGEVCKIPKRHLTACLGQRMMLYRTNPEKINNDYFLYALQSTAIQNRLDLISGGSTVGHVRVGDIRNLLIFYPKSESEQLRIAKSLNNITNKIETEYSHLNKLKMEKAGLMHDLLTSKVKVIPDDPEVAHAV